MKQKLLLWLERIAVVVLATALGLLLIYYYDLLDEIATASREVTLR